MLGYMLIGTPIWANKQPTDLVQEPAKLDRALADILTSHQLSPAIIDVCYNACRARPKDRFQCVDDLLAAMRNAMHRGRAPKATPKASERTRRDHVEEPSPWIEASPAATRPSTLDPDHDLVVLEELDHPDILAGGRRIKTRRIDDSADVEHVFQGTGAVRIRITLLPGVGPRTRIHVRGLNCFTRRTGGTPTSAVDLTDDTELELIGADRSVLGSVRFHLGERDAKTWMFHLPELRLAIASERTTDALFLAFPPSPDLCLMHTTPKGALPI
jgi:hypothetical protein